MARPRKSKLVATTRTRKGAEPVHHFFAANLGMWEASYDLATLVNKFLAEGYPFLVYLVPGTIDSEYAIEFFVPQVEGSQYLLSYLKDDTTN